MYLLFTASGEAGISTTETITNIFILFGVLLGPLLFIGCIVYNLVKVGIAWVNQRRRLLLYRSLPCQNCCYFSDCEDLRCAVNPLHVLTKEAHSCLDCVPIAQTEPSTFERLRKHLETVSSTYISSVFPAVFLKVFLKVFLRA